MTTEELKILREKLPRGAFNSIAQRTGFSYEHVRAVLNGRRYNTDIVEAAIRVAEEHKKEETRRKLKILSI